ncbi:prephenate dehydrogenase [Verrucomicrobiota bacterium]
MKRLAIIGLGLMGGSLGLAVKKKGLAESVCGYARREENRRDALKQGVVDSVCDRPEDAVKDADLVIFCVPVLVIPELVKICKSSLMDKCVVTDVGSTKAHVVSEVSALLGDSAAEFIGSHPMAGSDQNGLDAARMDLYNDAMVVITPSGSVDAETVTKVKEFWQSLGAEVVSMDPEKHDSIIARTSHLPHLVASMLVSNLVRDNDQEICRFCGSGFRDTTRIAGGSEDIWHDIVKTNKFSVGRELEELGKILKRVKAMIDKDDFDGVRRFLAECRHVRRGL